MAWHAQQGTSVDSGLEHQEFPDRAALKVDVRQRAGPYRYHIAKKM